MINTQIDWQKKIVGQHILSYVLNAITDKSSTHELEKFSLTDYKISDIECLFNMKDNDYCILITSMFETDKFINEITVALEYNYPILTQDVLPTKKTKFPHLLLCLILKISLHPILKKAN